MDGVLSVVFAILALVALVYSTRVYFASQRRKERERREAEAARLSDCQEVVRFYANFYGYLARLLIKKTELEEQIDQGVSAEELEDFIADRIAAVEGLELGTIGHPESDAPVILPAQFRDKHLYVVGKSGYGKTNFLRHLILQDFEAHNGVGVLAPEYELISEELLPFIPEHRIDDVIYFNPADENAPVVLNPLHVDDDADIDLHVDETFTILQRVVGEGGPRMDEILRHTLYALTERPGSTLLDIERLLDRNDATFRNEIIRKSTDERTRVFFANTYPQMPKDSHFPILNRIGRFVRAKYVRNCLCPPSSPSGITDCTNRSLNIRQAMDDGKILLFNLSDGLLGATASQLIGQLIVSKFQTATMSRADTSKHKRRPFYLYLDEFQNFCGVASQSYERMLSRARKYGLGLILAHQQTGQLPPALFREILGNISTLVSFQLSQSDAVRMSREFTAQVDFELEPVPPDEFMRLGIGQAYIKIGQNAFPLSVPKVSARPDGVIADEVLSSSRRQFGISRTNNDIMRPGDNTPTAFLDDLDPQQVFE